MLPTLVRHWSQLDRGAKVFFFSFLNWQIWYHWFGLGKILHVPILSLLFRIVPAHVHIAYLLKLKYSFFKKINMHNWSEAFADKNQGLIKVSTTCSVLATFFYRGFPPPPVNWWMLLTSIHKPEATTTVRSYGLSTFEVYVTHFGWVRGRAAHQQQETKTFSRYEPANIQEVWSRASFVHLASQAAGRFLMVYWQMDQTLNCRCH